MKKANYLNTHKRLLSSFDLKTAIIIAVVLFFQTFTFGQSNLTCNSTINPTALVTDYIIPSGLTSITFTIKGGDGGDAYLKGGTCDRRVKGGAGATVTATFEVGTAANQLQVGGTLRVFVGRKGGTEQTGCAPSPAPVSGSGGGSSAILYLPPGTDANGIGWFLLAEAGAGGGAARPAAGVFKSGGGGNSFEAGGGSGVSLGGSRSNGCAQSEGTPSAGIGGQYNCKRSSLKNGGRMVRSSSPGLYQLFPVVNAAATGGVSGNRPQGGDGFSGGGVQGSGGGGGGGYGGGATDVTFGGGGGGSFVNTFLKGSNKTKTSGGAGAGSESNGTASITTVANVLAQCQDKTVQLSANGAASITAQEIDNASTIGCGTGTMTLDKNFFTCNDIGENTITLTIKEDNKTSTCTAKVTVEDTVKPVAVCQNVTIDLNSDGIANLDAALLDNGSSDACGIATFSHNALPFNCESPTDQMVTLTVRDNNNNTSTCTATVSLNKLIPPIAVCKNHTVQLNVNGIGTLSPNDVDDGSSGVCGGVDLSVSKINFTCSDIGNNLVVLTARDGDRTASCQATVVVEDKGIPTARCKDATISFNGDTNADLTVNDVNFESSDLCGNIANYSLDVTSFDCDSPNNQMVTLTVTDEAGNASSCTANVFLDKSFTPTAVCTDVTIQLDATGNTILSGAEVGRLSTSICGRPTLSLSKTNFTCSDIGENVVILTVSDGEKTDNCRALVTVEQNNNGSALMAICKDITVKLDDNGLATITPQQVDNGSIIGCGNVNYELSTTQFNCSNLGLNAIELSISVEEGNSSSCEALVTVVDEVSPVAQCQDVTVNVDLDVDATLEASAVDNGSFDNCGNVSLSLDQTTFNCESPASQNVTLTVNDQNGNSATCMAMVSLNTAVPVASCKDITVQLDENGSFTISVDDIHDREESVCGAVSYSLDQISFSCSDVGSNTVRLTISNNTGNQSTCLAMVTVEDNIVPIARCKDATINLDDNGMATLFPGEIDMSPNDNCGPPQISLSKTTFDCSNVGSNVVFLTASDQSGNSTSCDANVTVQDITEPTALCKNVTVDLDENGNGSIEVEDVDNGSWDACGIADLTLSKTSFNCDDFDENLILEVTDQNGNTSSCVSFAIVNYSFPPTAVCVDKTVELIDGFGGLQESDIDGGSSALCGDVGLSINKEFFTCSDIGNNTVTLTVMDIRDNQSTCTSNVTVVNNQAPVAICQDVTVDIEIGVDAILEASTVDNGSFDNCGAVSLSLDQNTFNCESSSPQKLTLTATNQSGKKATCEAVVTLRKPRPTAVCKDVTVELDAKGLYRFSASDIDGGSSSTCGSLSLVTFSRDFYTCSDVGTISVALFAYNDYDSDTCIANITILDKLIPSANCQDVTIQLDNSGNASLEAATVDNGSNDKCGIAGLSLSQSSFDCSNLGTNNIVLTATDVNGNSSTCNAVVTVENSIAPNAQCQDLLVSLDDSGSAILDASAINDGSSVACGNLSLSLDKTNFSCSDIGDNIVTLTVSDESGKQSTCTANVMVVDNVEPIARCADLTLKLDDNGLVSFTAEQVNNGSSDACGIASLMTSLTSLDCGSIGSNDISLEVTDVNGNKSFCNSIITVEDDIAPIARCQDVTVNLDNNGNASLEAFALDNGSADNCAINSLSIDVTQFDCNSPLNQTVTLTVTDDSGNVSTCTSTVNVSRSAPTAVCKDYTIQLVNGMGTLMATDIDNGSSAFCNNETLSIDKELFDCQDIGDNAVTLTVSDGNTTATCVANVSVVDQEKPVASCKDITLKLDENASVNVTAQQFNNNTTDACGIASLSIDETIFDCSEVGENNIVLTATDNNGNTATCNAILTIEDDTAPIAQCGDETIFLEENGIAMLEASDLDNGSNDNCGVVQLSLNKTSFDCSNLGTNEVVFTVTDENGNHSTCISTVTVVDNTMPNAICQDITVNLDNNGEATIAASMVDNGSNDNCGIVSRSINKTSFDCSSQDGEVVTLIVRDQSGNENGCSSSITFNKPTPVAICKDYTLQLTSDEVSSLSVNDIDNGSNSVCGIEFLSLDNTTFSCSDIGSNTVTLRVVESIGNEATCTSNVTVEDKLAPIAMCTNKTIALNGNGIATLTAAEVDNGSTDNCGISNFTLDKTSFDCSNIGPNNVVLTATDVNGNSSTCMSTITVEDNMGPLAICQDITVGLGSGESPEDIAARVGASSQDNCGIASFTLDMTTYTCDDLGNNPVQLTVSDQSGNMATCNAVLTVEQGSGLGEFSTQSIGTTTGTASYDPCSGHYHLNSTPTASYDSKVGYGEFTYITLSGDFSFTAELKSLTSNGMGGLMVRESGDANALMAWVGKHRYSMTGGVNLNPGDQVISQRRGRASRTTIITVTRMGDLITFKQGRMTLLKVRMAMGMSMQVGMFLSSNNSSEAKASFNNVSYSTTNNTSAIQISNGNMSPYEGAGRESFSSEGGEAKVSPLRGLGGGKNTTLALKTWPNPTRDFVNIEVEAFIGNAATLNVFDLSGKLMLREDLGMIYQQQHIQDVQSLPAGVYIISLESAGQVAKSRVVVTR
ncbi:MAG: T9SS type A sorting domain-containing protein [Bacteroidota bacterium]